MTVRYELFAAGPKSPDELWDLVGDPQRLPEWTDFTAVEGADGPLAVGTCITASGPHGLLRFTVRTLDDRLIEIMTEDETLGIGIRVVRDPLGSRLILAGVHETQGAWDAIRTRLIDAPALRRRFDGWADTAFERA